MKANLFSFVAALCSLFILQSCNDGAAAPGGATAVPEFPVVEVSERDITGFTIFPASLEGVVNSDIRAKVPGYVKDVLVDEGSRVRKGQLLITLETESLSQDVSAAKARLTAAQVEVDKLLPLVEKEIISDVQLQTAKANLAQAKSSYQSVMANRDYANLRSPVDGVVGRINFRRGNLVSPSDPTPLTTVSDIHNIYAYFSLNEKDYITFLQQTPGNTLADKIENIPPVKLELANGSLYEKDGKIETFSAQVDPNTGTVSVRATFPNTGILTNGNSGKVLLPSPYEKAVVIPEVATYEQQGKVFVYKVSDSAVVRSSLVEVKDRIDGLLVLGKGLSAGERIVAKGVLKLQNDMRITPREVPMDSLVQSLNTVFQNQ